MVRVWSGRMAQTIDSRSQEQGIPALTLMEKAGEVIALLAFSLWKPQHHFLILAGGGNNGGDALVVARLLRSQKFPLTVIDLSDGKESAERAVQRQALIDSGVALESFAGDFSALGDRPLIVIDGVWGLGLKGKLRPGPALAALEAAAQLPRKTVIAIDLPSGLPADSWDEQEAPLPAQHTVTFGAPKPAHLASPSRHACGRIHTISLPFSEEVIEEQLAAQKPALRHAVQTPSLRSLWKSLAPDAHKFERGHVLILGGSPGKVGAMALAAEAAWQAGAGWVSLAPLSLELAPSFRSDFTVEKFALSGVIDEDQALAFLESRKVKGLLIGPGTMRSPLTRSLLEQLQKLQLKTGLRLIFDAGAVQNLWTLTEGLRFDPRRTLLTPHPGEWLRLGAQAAPLSGLDALPLALHELQSRGFSAIYKAASPLVLRENRVSFLTQGDARLARAGSGDCLAGLILGLVGTGRPLDELAICAQNLLAEAARRHPASLPPSNLIQNLKAQN